MTRSVPLGLCHLTILDADPARLLALAGRAGYARTTLRLISPSPGGTAYPLRPGSPELKAARTAMADAGVTVSDVEFGSLEPGTRVSDFDWVVASAAELGAASLNVSGDDPDCARLTDTFARLCELAAGHGVGVDLEFMRWRPVARLEDAVAIVSAARQPNGFVLLDSLHLFRSGGTAADVARTDPGLIRTVHWSDAPVPPPFDIDVVTEARTARYRPGDGQLPLAKLRDVLRSGLNHVVEQPMQRTARELSIEERLQESRFATKAFLAGAARPL